MVIDNKVGFEVNNRINEVFVRNFKNHSIEEIVTKEGFNDNLHSKEKVEEVIMEVVKVVNVFFNIEEDNSSRHLNSIDVVHKKDVRNYIYSLFYDDHNHIICFVFNDDFEKADKNVIIRIGIRNLNRGVFNFNYISNNVNGYGDYLEIRVLLNDNVVNVNYFDSIIDIIMFNDMDNRIVNRENR